MPTLKPVTKILLRVTADHIQQARALRRISIREGHIPIVGTCPLALAAREFFSRPVNATISSIGVVEEDTENYFQIFSHDGYDFVCQFDCGLYLSPTTITLTRNT